MPHVPQVQTLEKTVDNSQLHGREQDGHVPQLQYVDKFVEHH